MRRFYRGLIIGVFRLMRCDNIVASVEEVHTVAGHLAQPSAARNQFTATYINYVELELSLIALLRHH